MQNKNIFAFLIIFLVALTFLHPYFLGKVDIPVDLRDLRMYPWRYHAVDKKIKFHTLWEENILGAREFNLNIKPSQASNISFELDLKTKDINLVQNKKPCNFYIFFDFKIQEGKPVPFSFGASLVNKKNAKRFDPKVAIFPQEENKEWYRARFNINNLVTEFSSLDELNNYKVEIIARNKSHNDFVNFKIKDLKLLVEDYSQVNHIHNYYLTDLIQIFPQIREYFSSSIKKGKLPFWNNYILTGTEFLAEPQVGFFHPLYFISYLIFDHFTAHALVTFFTFLLCGIGTFLLLSFWNLGFTPSLFGSIVYMFHPFLVTHFGYEHTLLASSALPFLFLVFEKGINNKVFFNKYQLFGALLLGLIFLSGHLQVVYYTVLYFSLFVCFRFFQTLFFSRNNLLVVCISVLIIFIFGFMMSMVVVLPFLPLLENSHRVPNPEGFIKATSIPISAFLGLFCPFYKGLPTWQLAGFVDVHPSYDIYRKNFEFNYVYFGLLPFLISLFSIKGLLKRDHLVIFLLISIAFSLFVSMGSPLFYLLKDLLPGFKQMQHYRFIMLYSFSVPILAAIGFKYFFETVFKAKVLQVIILVLTILDLIFFSSFFVTWSKKEEYKPVYKGGAIEFLLKKQKESMELFRVLPITSDDTFAGDIAKPNTLFTYMIEDASGYSSFVPQDLYYAFVYMQTKNKEKLYSGKIFDLFSNVNVPYPISNYHSKLLDLLNVKYFLVPPKLKLESNNVKLVYNGDSAIYENLNSLPRAFVVPNYKVIESSKETIVYLDSDKFDLHKEVILMSKPVIAPLSSLQTKSWARNDIEFVKYQPENITLKVKAASPCFLVLGHNLNNNWKVKVNGMEDIFYKANLVQRAVYLPNAGSYSVEFYYHPTLFFIGTAISVCGIIIVLIFLMILWLKGRAHD